MPSTTLYIPLQFWFCRNPGLALPLIALQYHEVKINLEFREARNCFWGAGSFANSVPSLRAASLYVDYIYLDTDERRRFAQVSHEYLIEQLQFTGDESVHSTSNKIKLNFNHPCKELVWVVQPDSNVDLTSTRNFGGPQYFNYTDQVDPTYYTGTPSDPLGGGMAGAGAADPLNLHALSLASAAVNNTGLGASQPSNTAYPAAGGYQTPEGTGVAETEGAVGHAITEARGQGFAGLQYSDFFGGNFGANLGVFDAGKNPVVAAKLQLNGHDRFSEREGRYFNLVQPYQHHENVPATGVNVYSFGLKPEEHQPSGTCNMSRIDNATLHLTLSREAVKGNRTCKVRVYATNYNVLRIMSGMGGLAYSN
jgi:hypothetical protein